jgi:hypothetical protein
MKYVVPAPVNGAERVRVSPAIEAVESVET